MIVCAACPFLGAGSTFFRGCRGEGCEQKLFLGEKGRGRLVRVVALDRSLRWGEGFYPSIF